MNKVTIIAIGLICCTLAFFLGSYVASNKMEKKLEEMNLIVQDTVIERDSLVQEYQRELASLTRDYVALKKANLHRKQTIKVYRDSINSDLPRTVTGLEQEIQRFLDMVRIEEYNKKMNEVLSDTTGIY